jgi:HSP20 family protein
MAMLQWRQGFDPLQELERLQQEINTLFDTEQGEQNTGLFDRTVSPAIDVLETDNDFKVVCNLPGVEDKDIDVSVADNVLTIKGEKKQHNPDENAKVYRREDWSGSFQRTLSLPRSVDAEKIDAELKDGVLQLTMPKREEVKPRQIDVKVS